MRFRVIVKAGTEEMARAVVSAHDPATDVAQMLRATLQHYRTRNGEYADVPAITVEVVPIQDAEGR